VEGQESARCLLVRRRDMRRRQAVQREGVALDFGDGLTSVELRIGQQLVSAPRVDG
jgi:hypothetical protein